MYLALLPYPMKDDLMLASLANMNCIYFNVKINGANELSCV